MKSLFEYRKKAEELRRKGYSYGEILKEVPVARSSISLWLKDFPLTDAEKSYLKSRTTELADKGRIRAATALRMNRAIRDSFLLRDSKREFAEYKNDPFFLVGVSLYWAEGSKRGSSFGFTNSDPDMVALMLKWIREYLKPKEEEIKMRLYTHRPFINEDFEGFWSQRTGIPLSRFGKTIVKPSGLLVKKRPNYKGCVRIELGKVSYVRKMAFFEQMLVESYNK